MAYQTGSATDGTDLLHQLVTWLAGLGWNTDKSAVQGSGWQAHLDKDGIFVHLKSHFPGDTSWVNQDTTAGYALQLYLSTAFDGSLAWNAQPGNPPFASGTSQVIGAGAHLTAGPFTNYYFFADASADNIVVVVEITPSVYVHFGWGASIIASGVISGSGAYLFASTSGYYASDPSFTAPGWTSTSRCPGSENDSRGAGTALVLCDSDSFTGKWIGISDSGFGAGGFTGRVGASSVYGDAMPTHSIPAYARSRTSNPPEFQFQQSSQQDGRANLLPVLWWVGRDGSSGSTGGFSPVGSLPMVFFTNGVGNGFAAASVYSIGGDDYMMFPEFAVKKV